MHEGLILCWIAAKKLKSITIHENSQIICKLYTKFCYYVMFWYDCLGDSNPLSRLHRLSAEETASPTFRRIRRFQAIRSPMVHPRQSQHASIYGPALYLFVYGQMILEAECRANPFRSTHCLIAAIFFFLNLSITTVQYRIMQKIMANAVIPTDCG
jgi:hypothetical protein